MTKKLQFGQADEMRVQPIDLAACGYARLLFGGGRDAWEWDEDSHYTLTLRSTSRRLFTQQDYKACLEILRHEAGLKMNAANSSFKSGIMRFTIPANELDRMTTQYGLGDDAGMLATPTRVLNPGKSVHNNPLAVLEGMMRAHLLAPEAWKDCYQTMRGTTREATLSLPAGFSEHVPLIAAVSPEISLKSNAHHAWNQMMQRIPVAITLKQEMQGTTLRFSVRPQVYEKLNAAIVAGKEQPGSNVTSFQLARERLKMCPRTPVRNF